MKDSRNLALMFLLGAFLTGGVLGFTANRYMNREAGYLSSSESLMRLMSQRLRLSSQQQHVVDSLLDDRSRQYREAMAPVRPKLDSIKLSSRELIRRVLNEEQRAEFEALIAEFSDSTRKSKNE
jgi:Spy/CpxP family protein refolding chaperone